MTPLSSVFATFACLATLLLALTSVMHINKRNLPLSTLSIGLLILNSFNVINVFIWSHPNSSAWWSGKGLCDVEVKLYLGIGQSVIGITASIFRRLATILDTSKLTTGISANQRRNQLVFDAFMMFTLPGIVMGLHYLVQPNRFALSRFTGCRITGDPSWLAVILLWVWYPLTCAVCLYYASLTMLRLLQHRRQVNTILENSHRKTSRSRFVRLLGLSSILVIFLTPATAYFFILNVERGIGSGYSWGSIHDPNWSKEIIRDDTFDGIAADRWAQVFAGILSFLFFGVGKDAVETYSHIFSSIVPHRLPKRLQKLSKLFIKDQRSSLRQRRLSG